MGNLEAELSLGEVQELVAGVVPERDALRWRDQRVTYRQLTMDSRRLANFLLGRGLGSVVERVNLAPWEAGQDFIGLMLFNRPEYIVSLFGAMKARCIPFNINYRYGASEVRQLFATAPTRAIIYEVEFVDVIRESLPGLPPDLTLIEIGGSTQAALPGAISYQSVLATSSTDPPGASPSPDDLYVVFTGGTTGQPKAVMWRQADAWRSALNGPSDAPTSTAALRQLVEQRVPRSAKAILPAPPLMHGGGQWITLGNILRGHTIVIQDVVDRLDPGDIWRTVEREGVHTMLVAGNAYAVPLLDELKRTHYDLDSLRLLVTGAVAMTDGMKHALLERIPGLRIVENIGATESGTHLSTLVGQDHNALEQSGRGKIFTPSTDTVVLDETRSQRLAPGSPSEGWLARAGRTPLGYLEDRDRSRAVFPTIDGVRYAIPGDRARLLATGDIEFLGRDSATINSGGEKIFAEEIETALTVNPEVRDALVTGRDHERWGQEIVALVALRPGARVTADELRDRLALNLARYKIPKVIAFIDIIPRNAAGKADYVWAKRYATELVLGMST